MLRSTQLLTVLFVCIAAAACGSREDSRANQVAAPVIQQPAPEQPVVPRVDQPLVRRDLLLAAIEAGSNHVLGLDDKAEQQKLDGETFSFRMRLCGDAANATQSFDETKRVWKVEVQPDLETQSAVVGQMNDQAVAAEGFWVPHPFLLAHGCPRTVSPQAATGAAQNVPERTLGIAQFFGPDDLRADQRGSRPYSITQELAEGQAPEPVELVLQGRLQRLGSGKVINCVDDASGNRPTCVISVKLDRVELQTASGKSLGEWSRS